MAVKTGSEQVKNLMDTYLMPTYDRQFLAEADGKGAACLDEEGRNFIDFGSGIGVNSLGFCNEKWVEAVCAQAHRLQHTSNYYYTGVQGAFAQKLCQMTGYSRVFLGNSGAEANECAIKLARKYSLDKYGYKEGAPRSTIVTLENSFHGRTMATLSATGQEVFHKDFHPFLGGFIHTPANDLAALEKLLDSREDICGVLVEFIQGEGGVVPLEEDFAKGAYEICKKKDILFMADEVQTGCGRTGYMLAGDYYGIKPDVVTLAKGLGGGLPIGACLAKGELGEVMGKGSHGSTFGGNPIVCAGALEVLKAIDSEGFLEGVREKGQWLQRELEKSPKVAGVYGRGMMIGAALNGVEAGADGVLKGCLRDGLLILKAKDRVRLLPPLTASMEELKAGMEILQGVLEA